MVDPHQTISAPIKPKDQGYYELNKRNTIKHDLKSKVIQDYTGNSIIKIDSLHGEKNGLLWGQSTHTNLCGADRVNLRQTFGKDSPGATINTMRRFTKAGNDVMTPRKAASVRSSMAPSLIADRAVDFAEPGSETEKQLLARKLYLMRKMLKNERRANEIISDKLTDMVHGAHGASPTAQIINDSLANQDRGILKQPLIQSAYIKAAHWMNENPFHFKRERR